MLSVLYQDELVNCDRPTYCAGSAFRASASGIPFRYAMKIGSGEVPATPV